MKEVLAKQDEFNAEQVLSSAFDTTLQDICFHDVKVDDKYLDARDEEEPTPARTDRADTTKAKYQLIPKEDATIESPVASALSSISSPVSKSSRVMRMNRTNQSKGEGSASGLKKNKDKGMSW